MDARRKARLVIFAIGAVIVILLAARFAAIRGRKAAPSIEEIQAREGIPVDVAIVREGSISRYLDLLGHVQGYEQVEITSSLPIDITAIRKHEGEKVKKGDVVVMLARDRTGNAYHQYTIAKEAFEKAKRDAERMENLFAEGAVSKQMVEQARLAFRDARSQFIQARSMVDLVSPIDGIVTRVNAVEGQAAVPSIPLVTVARTDSVRIRCLVGQDEVRMLKTGERAIVCLSSIMEGGENSCEIEGRVSKVSLSADQETKLFLAEVVADNSQGKLDPGTVVAISVLVDKVEDVVTVPRDALVARENGSFVYLVRGGRARLIPVTLGVGNGTMVAVDGSVAPGDTLVVKGQFRLEDGRKVRIHGMSEGSSSQVSGTMP